MLTALFLGVMLGLAIAQIAASWDKSEVSPVVVVKPYIGGFAPVEGSAIGNVWPKSEVQPIVFVKRAGSNYVPVEEGGVWSAWAPDDVAAMVLVVPSGGRFVPNSDIDDAPEIAEAMAAATGGGFNARIAGEFQGWSGETIVKLDNGQIWQQAEYYYEYMYAYMPDVLVFESGGAFRMKVEGTGQSVTVVRLK